MITQGQKNQLDGWVRTFDVLQIDKMKQWIFLDDQSNSTTIIDPNMVQTIKNTDKVLDLH